MIYGQSKFTLVKQATKQKGESRLLPVNEQTTCGAQDINTRTKIKVEDSCFVVKIRSTTDEAHYKLCATLCLEPSGELVWVTNKMSSDKSLCSMKLGDNHVLLEQPNTQPRVVPDHRLVQIVTNFLYSRSSL